MEAFLLRNHLTVVNSLSLCKGVFTRIQKRQGICEKSIIDFFVVCRRVLTYVTSMDVDESKSNIASNYTQVRKGKKAVDSDHVPLEINIDMKIVPTKPTRNIVLNLKNYQAREIFKELTTHTEEFTKCFETLQPLQEQCETWKETLESYCKKTFKKKSESSQKE